MSERSAFIADVRLLEYCPPTSKPDPFGVLVFDSTQNILRWKFREDGVIGADEFDKELLAAFIGEFESQVKSMTPVIIFKLLDESLSNVLRITRAERIACESLDDLVKMKFEEWIGPSL